MVKVKLDFPKGLKDKIDKAPKKLRKEINDAIVLSGERFTELAVKDCPGDTGFLSGSIRPTKLGEAMVEVAVHKEYGAYMEFGTKSRFKPIEGVDASVYKGKGTGDYFDFLNNILDWVKRKGIGMGTLSETNAVRRRFKQKTVTKKDRLLDVAQAIANSISRHGVKPHPFFFKQIPIVKKETIDNIENILSELYD